MSCPTVGGFNRLKRVGRFLKGRGRCVQFFDMQDPVRQLDVETDSDFAGDLLDRKSTSAHHVFHGAHRIRSATSSQTVVALSSGEAEFAALTKGASVDFGCQALFRDLGRELALTVSTDSSAAKAIATRRGVGRTRHLHTHLLCVQQRVKDKALTLRKIDGARNRADLGAKELAGPKVAEILERCGFELRDGRHPRALRAQIGECEP